MQRQVLGGTIGYPIARAKEFLDIYADYGSRARDDLTSDFGMVIPPGGAPGFVGASVCYSGPPSEADRALAPIRSMGTPMIDDVGPMDYVALQRSGDVSDFRARAGYIKSGFIGEMTSEMTTIMAETIEGHPDRTTVVAIQQSGGKIGRVANDATAFSHREASGNLLCIVDWVFGTDRAEHVAYVKNYWAGLERFSQGFYVNDADADISVARVGANYRDNYERLVRIKNRYDPTNLFRLNSNVAPTV